MVCLLSTAHAENFNLTFSEGKLDDRAPLGMDYSQGTPHDYSLYNNHGDLIGQATSEGVLLLDGLNSYVLVPDDDTMDLAGHFTIGGWVNFDRIGVPRTAQEIISKHDSSSGRDGWVMFWLESNDSFFHTRIVTGKQS